MLITGYTHAATKILFRDVLTIFNRKIKISSYEDKEGCVLNYLQPVTDNTGKQLATLYNLTFTMKDFRLNPIINLASGSEWQFSGNKQIIKAY